MLIPYQIPETDTFDNRLKNIKNYDIQELIDQCKINIKMIILCFII